jgi:hypothetical protein
MDLANQTYYFEIAQGEWEGPFTFRVKDYPRLFKDRIGLVNGLLAITLDLIHRLVGSTKLVARNRPFPTEGEAGVSRTVVRVSLLGLTLYVLQGDYLLQSNGSDVRIWIHERFGPVPFLFWNFKHVSAAIGGSGLRATYWMPMLGTHWLGDYEVAADRNHVMATYQSSWGVVTETVQRRTITT